MAEIKYIRPFFNFVHEVLPQVYNDALSFQELLYKIMSKVDELIQNNNNFADYVKEELEKMLRKYIESGEIDSMIQELLDQYKEDIYIHSVENGSPIGANAILDVHGDIYIFDTGYQHGDVITEYMVEHGLTNIKGIIISHCDKDHYGNLNTILQASGLDFSECTVYLPHGGINTLDGIQGTVTYGSPIRYERNPKDPSDPELWPVYNTRPYKARLIEQYNEILTAVNTAGLPIVYPAEGQTVLLSGNCRLEFHNLEQSYYNAYYAEYFTGAGAYGSTLSPHTSAAQKVFNSAYNDFSMISNIYFWGHKVNISGDVQQMAQKLNYKTWVGADIVYAPHHAINKMVDEKYLTALAPEVFVIQTGEFTYAPFWLTKRDVVKAYQGGASVALTSESKNTVVTIPATSEPYLTYPGTAFNMAQMDHTYDWGSMPMKAGTIEGQPARVGTDCNAMFNPGMYECPNGTIAKTFLHTPFTSCGFKLMVEFVSENRIILQTAYANTSSTTVIAFRRGVLIKRVPSDTSVGKELYNLGKNPETDGDTFIQWSGWEYCYPSEYQSRYLTVADYQIGVARDSTNNTLIEQQPFNRLRSINNMTMLNIRFKPTADQGSGTMIIDFKRDKKINQTYFVLEDYTAGTPVLFSVSSDDDVDPSSPAFKHTHIYCRQALVADHVYAGTVTFIQNPYEPEAAVYDN